MMPSALLKAFLDKNEVKYVAISHSRAYTAQEAAALAHIPGKDLAKTIIVKLDGNMVMAVLPASYRIEMNQLATAAGVTTAELATESEFKDRFEDCDTGAMPPFGNLYGMDVDVAESLAEDDEIAFSAGSHRELVKLAYADFERLVQPKVLRFSELTAPG